MSPVASPSPRARFAGRPAGRRASARTHELGWRLLLDEPQAGARNMALDHALAACLGDGQGVVRLYGWSRPTLSFGRNEPAKPAVPLRGTPGRAPEPDYVRRPTGGRAVLHDDELTYAVVAPLDAFGGLREAYLRINQGLAEALAALGADVDVAGRPAAAGRTPALDAGPCFQSPAPGEIVAAGRKLVGSAQARLEGVLLQHGSILLGGDHGAGAVTLAELLGHVERADVAPAVASALRGNFGGSWHEDMYDDDERAAAARLETERYGQATWTWRRRQECI